MAEIHPIRTEADYERALAEIAPLVEQDPAPDSPEGERLEVLSILVQDYEARHHAILAPDDPLEVIRFYMEKNNLSRKDMEAYLGDKARVSDILKGRRGLSLAMIRALSQGLGIPAELLIGGSSGSSNRPVRGGARVYPAP